MTVREANELKNLRIMRLVLDNFLQCERFTNKDVKRLIERDNRWASGEECMPSAAERCHKWIEAHSFDIVPLIVLPFDGGCNVVNAKTNVLYHVERDNYQPHELPTGKSFSDRFRYAHWVDMERERFKISEKTIVNHDILTNSYVNHRPYLDNDIALTNWDIVIDEPFYGERYIFSINNNAEDIYAKLLRDYQHGVQLCITSCALKFMARFGLTAEEYVELVNNIVE